MSLDLSVAHYFKGWSSDLKLIQWVELESSHFVLKVCRMIRIIRMLFERGKMEDFYHVGTTSVTLISYYSNPPLPNRTFLAILAACMMQIYLVLLSTYIRL